MLMGFIGRMGQGKTLSMTAFGSYMHQATGCALYSRHDVVGATSIYKPNQIWEIENGIFLWDEMWVDMDSREWKNNIDRTRFILQSRKKNTIVMYTAQHYSQIEKRVRKATDYVAFCEKRYNKDTQKTQINLQIVDAHTGKIMKIISIMDIKPFFGLYDTYQVIRTMKSSRGEN